MTIAVTSDQSTKSMELTGYADGGECQVRLDDGIMVTLREAVAGNEDVERLREMAARIGPDTYWRYFHVGGSYNDMWAERVAALGRRNGPDDYVLVAEAAGQLIGVARLGRRLTAATPSEQGAQGAQQEMADFGILLEDAWQGRHLGRHVVYRLAREARRRAVDLLVGDILYDNRRMMRLALRICPEAKIKYAGGGESVLLLALDRLAPAAEIGVGCWCAENERAER